MFLDSDTKISLISSAPSDIEQDWFLTNQQMADARKKVNDEAGSRRLFAHAIFTPGQPGWLEKLDAALALKPESCKGYTVGDNTHKEISRYPWRMDDEKVAYKGYEKMVKAGIKNVCIHKGLFAPGVEKQYPNLRGFADVADVGQAAKDWPQLNFVIYHSAYRHVGGDPKQALAEFERTGRISWTSDLADIPAQYGVNNVYGDVGQLFATTLVAEPNVCAALMGTLIKGLGVDHVCWGTDALWTGAPQWQIEGLRRLEIPEAMQKKFGYAPLGAADGPVKSAIFGGNNARLYDIQPKRAMLELKGDRFALMKAEYEKAGPEPSNTRYGYVVPNGPMDQGCLRRLDRHSGARVARARNPSVPQVQWRNGFRVLAYARPGMTGRHFFSAGSRCTGSIHSTVSGFSTGSMSRLIATASPSLRTSTHSSTSSRLALISWCGT